MFRYISFVVSHLVFKKLDLLYGLWADIIFSFIDGVCVKVGWQADQVRHVRGNAAIFVNRSTAILDYLRLYL